MSVFLGDLQYQAKDYTSAAKTFVAALNAGIELKHDPELRIRSARALHQLQRDSDARTILSKVFEKGALEPVLESDALKVRYMVSGSNLAITSEGGNGGGTDGGGGGGGYQRSLICENNGSVTVSTNGGTGGTSGSSGNSNNLVSPVSDYYICK
jgi:hypothetical protein